jgi:REP element-mobilizing transposase RayT
VTLFRDQYRVETVRFAKWDYRSPGWYFVTVCTKNKNCSLGQMIGGKIALSPAGQIADREISSINKHHSNVAADISVVMPNHIHTLIMIDGPGQYSPDSAPLAVRAGPSLATIIGGYKAAVSRLCRRDGITDFQWQPRFHERILGSNAAVDAVRGYIRQNPENWQEDPDNPTSVKVTRSNVAAP